MEEVLGAANQRVVPLDALELNSELREYVDSHVKRRWSPRKKLESLRKMLFDPDSLNLQYDNVKTKTAIETFESRRGNCLSMTNLFISAARYMDLDAHYQVVAIKPTWERTGTTMIRNEHINAVGKYQQGTSYSIDFLPELYYDEPKTYRISDKQAVALYYNNLGAEYLISGEPIQAVQHLRTAIHIDPNLADGWNNMGAAQRRLENRHLSEFSYIRAIQIDDRNYTAMSNLARFYGESGDTKKANKFMERVERFRKQNPYHLYFQARSAIEKQDYKTALRKLKKAIIKKNNEPDFYAALAMLYRQMGDLRRSKATLARAAKYTDSSEKNEFERKMEILIH